MNKQNTLLCHVQYFFQTHLSQDRGLSVNTIFAYRDTLRLFLEFVAAFKNKPIKRLALEDLHADATLAFLKNIEDKRKNSPVTRNLRLAALKTFFSYMITKDTLRVGQYQKIISIPQKRAPKPLIGYLEAQEVEAIFNAINQNSTSGQRDYVLLKFLYNTGARAQEVCDLSVRDIQLHNPAWVMITGKGRKTRQVPLWTETSDLLKIHLKNKDVLDKEEANLFVNSRGEKLTRFGIWHIVRTRIVQAIPKCPSLGTRKIGPHSFRHTTGMHLLQAGVDLTVIKSWLGHVNLSTTHGYVEIDLQMKRKALSMCHPIGESKELQKIIKKNHDVISWLKSF
jgi:site-specific recombinase XerD